MPVGVRIDLAPAVAGLAACTAAALWWTSCAQPWQIDTPMSASTVALLRVAIAAVLHATCTAAMLTSLWGIRRIDSQMRLRTAAPGVLLDAATSALLVSVIRTFVPNHVGDEFLPDASVLVSLGQRVAAYLALAILLVSGTLAATRDAATLRRLSASVVVGVACLWVGIGRISTESLPSRLPLVSAVDAHESGRWTSYFPVSGPTVAMDAAGNLRDVDGFFVRAPMRDARRRRRWPLPPCQRGLPDGAYFIQFAVDEGATSSSIAACVDAARSAGFTEVNLVARAPSRHEEVLGSPWVRLVPSFHSGVGGFVHAPIPLRPPHVPEGDLQPWLVRGPADVEAIPRTPRSFYSFEGWHRVRGSGLLRQPRLHIHFAPTVTTAVVVSALVRASDNVAMVTFDSSAAPAE